MNGIELNAALGGMNDIAVIQGIVKRMRFIDYVRVTKVNGDFVDGKRGDVILTNIEVLSIGGNGYAITIKPKVDDIVLVFSSRTYIKDMKDFQQNTGIDSYSNPTLKCIPICNYTNAKSTITIDENGFNFTDQNDNSVILNSDGINVTDSNGNTISMSSSGVDINDSNGNTISMSSSGVDINGKLTISS